MKQVYHTNATTNIRLRKEINKSNLTIKELSEKYRGVRKYCKKVEKQKDLYR